MYALWQSLFNDMTEILTPTLFYINNQFVEKLNYTDDSAEHINYTVLMLCKQCQTDEI